MLWFCAMGLCNFFCVLVLSVASADIKISQSVSDNIVSKPENPKGKINKWFSLEKQGLLETKQQSGAFMRSCLSFFCFIKKFILSADSGDVY